MSKALLSLSLPQYILNCFGLSVSFLLIILRLLRRYLYLCTSSSTLKAVFFWSSFLHPYRKAWIDSWIIAFRIIFSSRFIPVVVTWDYSVCNCRFGDYTFALTIVRLLACTGFHVVFAEVYSECDKFYRGKDDPGFKDGLYDAFIEQRDSLKLYTQSQYANISFWEGGFTDFLSLFDNPSCRVLAHDRVFKRAYTIAHYHNLITPLYCLLRGSEKQRFRDCLSPYASNGCIISNFRYNPSNPDKNNSIGEFTALSDIACRVGRSLVVSTDSVGYAFLDQINSSIPMPFNFQVLEGSGYLDDYNQIASSFLYCQFHGGGMAAMPMVFSSVPYVIYQRTGYLVQWSRDQAFPFSSTSQVFRNSLDFDSYLECLGSLLERLRG